MNRAILTRLAQSVERQPFKLVVVGSTPTSGGGKRQSLGLEPEVSDEEMEKHYPLVKWCFTVLSEKSGEAGLKTFFLYINPMINI